MAKNSLRRWRITTCIVCIKEKRMTQWRARARVCVWKENHAATFPVSARAREKTVLKQKSYEPRKLFANFAIVVRVPRTRFEKKKKQRLFSLSFCLFKYRKITKDLSCVHGGRFSQTLYNTRHSYYKRTFLMSHHFLYRCPLILRRNRAST